MSGQLQLPIARGLWIVSNKYDACGAALADAHYTRRKRSIGKRQYMPPGETMVLITRRGDAVFGWWRPHPRSGLKAMNGLDGWTCSIFRNTSAVLSSELILGAEQELIEADARGDLAGPCGPDGLLTYVQPSKLQSTNPGWCFQLAGWLRAEWGKKTGKQRKRLLRKPWRLAGVAACTWDARTVEVRQASDANNIPAHSSSQRRRPS